MRRSWIAPTKKTMERIATGASTLPYGRIAKNGLCQPAQPIVYCASMTETVIFLCAHLVPRQDREPSPVLGRIDSTQRRKRRQSQISENYAGQPVHKNNSMSGSVGSSKGQKFQLFKMVLVASGTYRSKESNYCCFQKTAENDLHSFGKGAVLRSKLCCKSNRMNTAPIEFLSRGITGTCFAHFLMVLFVRVHANRPLCYIRLNSNEIYFSFSIARSKI